MTNAPDLPPPPDPAPAPAQIEPGYYALRDLVEQTVEVTAVEDLDDVPVIVANGRRYLATGEWAESGALTIGGHLATGSGPVAVRVVDHNGHVGFAPATV